jgi:hypothetical protein
MVKTMVKMVVVVEMGVQMPVKAQVPFRRKPVEIEIYFDFDSVASQVVVVAVVVEWWETLVVVAVMKEEEQKWVLQLLLTLLVSFLLW